MDALRHANQGGVAPRGGVVIAVGDDPTGRSGTWPISQTRVLLPSGCLDFFPRRVEDIIPMGLEAFALSRHAGCCVGLKITVDTADASVILDMGAIRRAFLCRKPKPGRCISGDMIRRCCVKPGCRPCACLLSGAGAEANPSAVLASPMPEKPKLGIVSVGKATPETTEALRLAGRE